MSLTAERQGVVSGLSLRLPRLPLPGPPPYQPNTAGVRATHMSWAECPFMSDSPNPHPDTMSPPACVLSLEVGGASVRTDSQLSEPRRVPGLGGVARPMPAVSPGPCSFLPFKIISGAASGPISGFSFALSSFCLSFLQSIYCASGGSSDPYSPHWPLPKSLSVIR